MVTLNVCLTLNVKQNNCQTADFLRIMTYSKGMTDIQTVLLLWLPKRTRQNARPCKKTSREGKRRRASLIPSVILLSELWKNAHIRFCLNIGFGKYCSPSERSPSNMSPVSIFYTWVEQSCLQIYSILLSGFY